ncbi:GNAT family N-acetyltransferase [Domibacillus sp. A3M-37]|uniref:GNAT family N-acetyltransferase n=1 Tax=Domibacillus sp. A3M-37 TaxID=2962037 RepID=UPI0020B72258|nr:GNAT family N-acetyltransferase [Domibacillus sp. A3M-37]MCP3760958.1 GNAT family N-acetyltransferase [Domibacillus sp. A3M-37]
MGEIKQAGLRDLPEIALLKFAMFTEVGMNHILRDDFLLAVEKTYLSLYAEEKAIHFVIRKNNVIIACAGAFLKEDIPYCFYRNSEYGFIGDVYVHPDFRKKGYARSLTNAALDWFAEKGIQTIRLLASDQAKPLYESMGFKGTDQMMLNR